MTPTEEYRDKMNDLAGDLADAVVEAGRAWLLARNIDGMPEADLLKIKRQLEAIERDVESLIDYGVTSTETFTLPPRRNACESPRDRGGR